MSDELFSRWVHSQRKDKKLSLRALAQATGIAASTISRIENGQLSPTLAIAEKLATALDLQAGPFLRVKAVEAHHPQVAADSSSESKRSARIIVHRPLRRMLIPRGIRRDLSRIAARTGYETAILLSGALQLRANDGYRQNMKPGAAIVCSLITEQTIFAIATQDAELLWIGLPISR